MKNIPPHKSGDIYDAITQKRYKIIVLSIKCLVDEEASLVPDPIAVL